MRRTSLSLWSLSLICATHLASAPALAGVTFSIDFQGPTAGAPDGFLGVPTGEGDILTPMPPGPPGPNPATPGPIPPPGIEVGALGGSPGIVPGGLGVLPGAFGFVEVDALSYGRDVGAVLHFSVDEFATGIPTPLPPDVFSEGSLGAAEASADIFSYLGALVPTPPGPTFGNAAFIDGDGMAPGAPLALGLIEPNPPTPGAIPDPGDNVDAVDLDTANPDLIGPIFFSLDSAFPDPREVFPPVNNGTAAANGFSGADVLMTFAGAAPVIAIPALALGLDLPGFDKDDLDALIFDDADGSLNLTPPDTIYFSVRHGSAVIFAPDSCFGIPIEEGDILTLPAGAGLPPCIFIAAEALGLATIRSGTAGPFGADELDALDVIQAAPLPALGPLAHGIVSALLLATAMSAVRLRRPLRE